MADPKKAGSDSQEVRTPRAGWAEAFSELAAEGDEGLLLGDFPNQWDDEEWVWEDESKTDGTK